MPIIYGCVNEGTTLLAEYPLDCDPAVRDTVQIVLSSAQSDEHQRKTVHDTDSGANYNYICNGEGRVIVCVSTCDVRMRTAFAFLEAIEPIVRSSAGTSSPEIRNGRKLLQQKMSFYNDPSNEKITTLNKDISHVTDIMKINLDKALVRGDRLEQLQQKSASLTDQAEQFQRRSIELKRNLCLGNLKLSLLIFGAVAVVTVIICLIACKPNFSRCRR